MTDFLKILNIKFHKNPPSGRQRILNLLHMCEPWDYTLQCFLSNPLTLICCIILHTLLNIHNRKRLTVKTRGTKEEDGLPWH